MLEITQTHIHTNSLAVTARTCLLIGLVPVHRNSEMRHQAWEPLSHGRRHGRHNLGHTGRFGWFNRQGRRGALAKPPPRAQYRVRDVVLRRGATTAPKTMVRNGPERNSHSKPMCGIIIVYRRTVSTCYTLNVDRPDRHDRLKALWSYSGIRSMTRVMSPALPRALPWASALPWRAGHRELVRRWAHGHALW